MLIGSPNTSSGPWESELGILRPPSAESFAVGRLGVGRARAGASAGHIAGLPGLPAGPITGEAGPQVDLRVGLGVAVGAGGDLDQDGHPAGLFAGDVGDGVGRAALGAAVAEFPIDLAEPDAFGPLALSGAPCLELVPQGGRLRYSRARRHLARSWHEPEGVGHGPASRTACLQTCSA